MVMGNARRKCGVSRRVSRLAWNVGLGVERLVSETVQEFFAKCIAQVAPALRSAGLLLSGVWNRFRTKFQLRHLTAGSSRGGSGAGNPRSRRTGPGRPEYNGIPSAIAAAAKHDTPAKHHAPAKNHTSAGHDTSVKHDTSAEHNNNPAKHDTATGAAPGRAASQEAG